MPGGKAEWDVRVDAWEQRGFECNYFGAANGASQAPRAEVDGSDVLHVAFESLATDLIDTDGNGFRDMFLRNTLSGTTLRKNEGLGKLEADGPSKAADLGSGDGPTAFESDAVNLIGPLTDTNGSSDAFVSQP